MSQVRQHKHSVLLVALIAMAVLQPLAHGLVGGLLLFDVFFSFLLLAVFLVVFSRPTDRKVAIVMGLSAIVTPWIGYTVSGDAHRALMTAHHALLLIFFAFAVYVLLRGVFEDRRIRADHVVGVACGYLLAGAAWGNAFWLTERYSPHSFTVNPEIAAQLSDDHDSAFLFQYFSFCTLTSAGFGDITPIGPPAAVLTWLEAMFGQFYIAIVVAQLVGLKLAQAVTSAEHRRSGET